MMKKIFTVMLLFATMGVMFSACSKDDDDNVELTSAQVVGTWDVTWIKEGGESLDIPSGNVQMNLKSDGSYKVKMFSDYYIGTYQIKGNTVVGVTIDPITEYYKFTRLDGNYAEIDYSNSDGDKYKFKANKK